jgi:hypothetical protein
VKAFQSYEEESKFKMAAMVAILKKLCNWFSKAILPLIDQIHIIHNMAEG